MIAKGSRVRHMTMQRYGIVLSDEWRGSVAVLFDDTDSEARVSLSLLREVVTAGDSEARANAQQIRLAPAPSAIHDDLVMSYAHDTGALKSLVAHISACTAAAIRATIEDRPETVSFYLQTIAHEILGTAETLKTGFPELTDQRVTPSTGQDDSAPGRLIS